MRVVEGEGRPRSAVPTFLSSTDDVSLLLPVQFVSLHNSVMFRACTDDVTNACSLRLSANTHVHCDVHVFHTCTYMYIRESRGDGVPSVTNAYM